MIDDVSIGLYKSNSTKNWYGLVNDLWKYEKLHKRSKDLKRKYRLRYTWIKDKKLLTLNFSKQPEIFWGPDYIFSFHVSQFNDFAELQEWLVSLMGDYYDEIMNADLCRLDPCLETTDFNIDYLFFNARRRNSRKFTKIGEFYENRRWSNNL